MSAKFKFMIGLLAFALLITVAAFGYNRLSAKYHPISDPTPSSSQTDEAEADPAPDFTVTDRDGNAVTLSSFQGKPVVLNFWASWCPPCQAEMPDYEKMYQQYSSQGVVFMMVDLTDGIRETKDTAQQFLTANNYTFSVYYDLTGDAVNAYAISTIPNSFFIDKDGKIVKSYRTMLDAETMKKSIEQILK